MFSFKKSDEKKIELVRAKRDNYLMILTALAQILKRANLNTHYEIIENLIELLNLDKIDNFKKQLNTIDMWGGSGAVWEVYIEDKSEARNFESQIINLIDLMEDTNILGNGVKPIRKFFKKNRLNDNSL